MRSAEFLLSTHLDLGSVGSIALRVDRLLPDASDALIVDRVHPGHLAGLRTAVRPGDVLAAVDHVPLRRAPLVLLADALRAAVSDQRGRMQPLSFRGGSEVYAVDSPRQLLPGAVLTSTRALPCREARLERARYVHDRLYIRVLDHEI